MAVITVSLAKEHLQISHSNQDNVIAKYIATAQSFVEEYCGIHFDEDGEAITDFLDGGFNGLWVSKKPISSVTSVTDTEGDGTAIESTEYKTTETFIALDDSQLWASGTRRWKVIYLAGLSATNKPTWFNALIGEVLNLVYHYYWTRGNNKTYNKDTLKLYNINREIA